MKLSHSNKNGKRYRYYVSHAIIQGNRNQAGTLTKISLGEIENIVKQEISRFISDRNAIREHIAYFDVHKQKEILSKSQKLELEHVFIRAILAKVILHKEKVEIIFCRKQLIKVLESIVTGNPLFEEVESEPEEPITITKNIRISTTSRNGSVLIVNNAKNKEVNINPFLVKIIAKSYYWNKLIDEGKAQHSKDIQKIENLTDNDYIKEALRLKILSPRIVEAILNGYQPEDITVQRLLKIKTLDWHEQERILNIA